MMSSPGAQRVIALIMVLFGWGAEGARAQETWVINATLIDPLEGTAQEGMVLKLLGTKIDGVYPLSEYQSVRRNQSPSQVIDAKGLYVVPGLIDASVHVFDPPLCASLFLAHGVTTVRDVGGPTEALVEIAKDWSVHGSQGPEILYTGASLGGSDPSWPFSLTTRSKEEANASLERLKSAGVNQVAVENSLGLDLYQAIAQKALADDLSLVGEWPREMIPERAMKAGHRARDGLDWLILAAKSPDGELDRLWTALFDEMRERRFVVVPRMVTIPGMASWDEQDAQWVPDDLIEFWESLEQEAKWTSTESRESWLRLLGHLDRAGVDLVLGTGVLLPRVVAGKSLVDEMKLWQEAGLSPSRILRAATLDAATFLGREDLGRLEKGATASFLLVRANPLEDVSALAELESVFSRGHRFSREALDSLLVQSKQRAKITLGDLSQRVEGVVKIRGRFHSTLHGQTLGVEDVAVAQSDQGLQILVEHDSEAEPPSTVDYRLDDQGRMIQATWTRKTLPQQVATYRRRGDRVMIDVRSDAKVEGEGPMATRAERDLGERDFLLGPAQALDYLFLKNLDLMIDEEVTLNLRGFGFSNWDLSDVRLTLTRRDDDTLFLDQGRRMKTLYYSAHYVTDSLEYTAEIWCRDDGWPMRIKTKLPFGLVVVAFEETPMTPR